MNNNIEQVELPPIPDKRYFTIGETSRLCAVKPHVLRYWEQEFPQLKPSKRRGRRYYEPSDVAKIREIRNLLYEQGFTINGARAHMSNHKAVEQAADVAQSHHNLQQMIDELEEILVSLKQDSAST